MPLLMSFLPGIVCVLAFWIGILALAGQRDAPWWIMLVGESLHTFGYVLTAAISIMGFLNGSPKQYDVIQFYSIAFVVSSFGTILFAGGFVGLALKRAGILRRQKELEEVMGAMENELRQLRNKSS